MQDSQQRRGSARRGAVLGLALFVVACGLWLMSRDSGSIRDVGSGEMEFRRLETERQGTDVSAPTDTGRGRLADVVPRDPARGDKAPVALETAPPTRPGVYRFEGVVVSTDGQPFVSEAAVVRVYRSTNREHDELLGVAPVRASGVFWLDLTGLSSFGAGDVTVYGQLTAPGYEDGYAEGTLSEAKGGVIRVTIEVNRGQGKCIGVVLSAKGEPVPYAQVQTVDWGPSGQDLYTEEYEADADGTFSFDLRFHAWVDVLATHPSFGVGKYGGRLPPGSKLLDLGPVVLVEQGVVSGTLRGYGGHGIPGGEVVAYPAHETDEDSWDSHVIRTGPNGTFRFANLDPIPYRILNEYWDDEENAPVVTPDADGITVRIARPSLHVEVLDPSGKPWQPETFRIRPLDPETGLARAHDQGPWTNGHNTSTGVWDIFVEKPMSVAIGAYHFVGEERYSATTVVKIGNEHRDVTLRLEREERVPIRLVVEDAAGAPIDAWKASIKDPRTDVGVASLSSEFPEAMLPAGEWKITATPSAPAFALPVHAIVDAPEAGSTQGAPTTFTLRTESNGGRIALSMQLGRGVEPRFSPKAYGLVRIRDGSKKRKKWKDKKWKLDGAPYEHPVLFPPGTYTLILQALDRKGSEERKTVETVVISPGEITRLDVVFRD